MTVLCIKHDVGTKISNSNYMGEERGVIRAKVPRNLGVQKEERNTEELLKVHSLIWCPLADF